jgi:outer membrane protein assembly factor BamB
MEGNVIRTTKERFGDFPGWRVDVSPPRSIATPAVAGSVVVFGGGFGSHEVYAVVARTGEECWTLRTKDDGPTAATLIDGVAFVNTESCTLEAIEVKTGRLLWERWLGDPLLAQPTAAGDLVLMVWPAAGTHYLGAFEVRSGAPRWQVPVPADVISAPVAHDGQVWLTTYDGAVSCFTAGEGEHLWTRPMHATSAPWIMDGQVFVARRQESAAPESQETPGWQESGAYAAAGVRSALADAEDEAWERISSLDAQWGTARADYRASRAPYLRSDHGAERKRMYSSHDAAVGFFHSPASAKLHLASRLIGEQTVSRAWRFQGSRPVAATGILYETTGDRLQATEVASGNVLWHWGGDAGVLEGERRLTPPVVARGRVVVGTWDGRLVSLDARSGAVRWQVPVGGPVHWQPVMSGGRVFAGLENGTVVCIETRDLMDDGWPMWGGGPGHNGL